MIISINNSATRIPYGPGPNNDSQQVVLMNLRQSNPSYIIPTHAHFYISARIFHHILSVQCAGADPITKNSQTIKKKYKIFCTCE